MPTAHVTGMMLPLISPGFPSGGSVECTHRCLGRGIPDFLNLFLKAFANPSPVTLWKGAVEIFVGSVLSAAPMEDSMGIVRPSRPSVHLWIRCALQSTESIASITKSQSARRSLKSSDDSGV